MACCRTVRQSNNMITWVWGREPWSSGYGKRLTFQRSWVRIPAPYTGWTFFTYCKNCNVCLKRPKINKKEAGVGPFLIKKNMIVCKQCIRKHQILLFNGCSCSCPHLAWLLIEKWTHIVIKLDCFSPGTGGLNIGNERTKNCGVSIWSGYTYWQNKNDNKDIPH